MSVLEYSANSKRMVNLFTQIERTEKENDEFLALLEKQASYLNSLDFTKLTETQQHELDDLMYVYRHFDEHLQRYNNTTMESFLKKLLQ